MRHVVSGRHWYDHAAHKWVKAGAAVLQYISEHPHQRHFLGFPEADSFQVGEFLLSFILGRPNVLHLQVQ